MGRPVVPGKTKGKSVRKIAAISGVRSMMRVMRR